LSSSSCSSHQPDKRAKPRKRQTQRRPSGNREHWKEMLFPFTRFERSDLKITNYMNAKTQREWKGTDKPGTVFQVPSLLFRVYRLHLWSFIAGKISGSQSYSQCAQSRIIFLFRLLKSYRQMFQPEAKGLSKIYYTTLCTEYLKGEAFLKNLRSSNGASCEGEVHYVFVISQN